MEKFVKPLCKRPRWCVNTDCAMEGLRVKKKRLIISALVLFLIILAVAAAILLRPKQKSIYFGEPFEQQAWELDAGWSVVQNDAGKKTVLAEGTGTTTSWNMEQLLAENWCVSTDVYLTGDIRDRSCARLVFGDDFGNVCVAVSVEYAGDSNIQVLADVLLNRGGRLEKDGWRNVYATGSWIAIESGEPIRLSVSHVAGDQLLLITLEQNDTVILQDFSEEIHQDILTLLKRAGLGIYDAHVAFSEFAVEEIG